MADMYRAYSSLKLGNVRVTETESQNFEEATFTYTGAIRACCLIAIAI